MDKHSYMNHFSESDLHIDGEVIAVAREMPVGFHIIPMSNDKFCPGGQQKPGKVLFLNQSIVGKCESCSTFFVFNPQFMEWVEQKD